MPRGIPNRPRRGRRPKTDDDLRSEIVALRVALGQARSRDARIEWLFDDSEDGGEGVLRDYGIHPDTVRDLKERVRKLEDQLAATRAVLRI